ncbi:MAG: stage II sporulation protein M [Candidatus Hodarchaeales archaeon]|jgi:uncharacterized membrane protein SpoIIM required for sporulation
MVLESLFTVKKLFKSPLDILILSVVICLASIFLSHLIFPGPSSGKITTLFITIAMTPLLYKMFTIEEEIEKKQATGKIRRSFLWRHGETIIFFTVFFIGVTITVFFVAMILPESYVIDTFEDQLSEIARIGASGSILHPSALEVIILNNFRVMILAFLLSFLLGTGALVILSWNASILGLYLASFLKKGLVVEFLTRTVGIMPHAPIEIGAYFLAGIAGGILSIGVIREQLKSKAFLLVMKDALIMLVIALIAVVLGAYVEVFI